MGKSKHSDEATIKLGKKLVNELNLNDSVDTLSRWMAHYIAELIRKAENASSEIERANYKSQCFNSILDLWNRKANLPNVQRPLDNLEVPLKLLNKMKENKFSYDYFRYFNDIPKEINWDDFVEAVKKNSESIFEICMFAVLNKDLIAKEVFWTENYSEFLTEDEKTIINNFKYLCERSEIYIGKELPTIERSNDERINFLLNKVSELIEDQKKQLERLRERVIKKSKVSKKKK